MLTVTEAALSAEVSLLDIVRERRSIRRFRDESVPRKLVEEVLRQALWAPSPHNSQPWRFTVLFSAGDKGRLADAMGARLAAELEGDGMSPALIEQQVGRSRHRISSAPVVILCSLSPDGLVAYPDRRRNDLEFQMAVQSVGAVLQTVFLLAAAHGLGACWMAAPMYCPELVREVLGLPDDHVPQALALLGYPAAPGKVRERRPFEEVVDLR